MKFIRSVTHIINFKTLVVTLLAIGATWTCIRFDITANFPLTIIGVAIVFPIVFSISGAFKRRERALIALAEIRGFALGLYQTAQNLTNDYTEEDSKRMQTKIIDLFRSIKVFLESPRDQSKELEKKIYVQLDNLSKEIRILKDKGLSGRFASRLTSFLTRVTVAIDTMKVIFYYRTPRTLRAYSKVFIFSFPLIYAPYFALISFDYANWLAYAMPVLFSFILVSLDNIQEHLEDPYDQIGEDDITLDIEDVKAMVSAE
jgi:predicted membrane chloride channel (bestrophin family)